MKHLVCDDGSLFSMEDRNWEINVNSPSMTMFRNYVRDNTLEVGQKWMVRLFPHLPDRMNLVCIEIQEITEKCIHFTTDGRWTETREIHTIKYVEKVRQ